jgi:hypothetical protein
MLDQIAAEFERVTAFLSQARDRVAPAQALAA